MPVIAPGCRGRSRRSDTPCRYRRLPRGIPAELAHSCVSNLLLVCSYNCRLSAFWWRNRSDDSLRLRSAESWSPGRALVAVDVRVVLAQQRGAVDVDGESDSLIGQPTVVNSPRSGWSTRTTMSLAASEASSMISLVERIGPQGMLCSVRISSACHLPRPIVHSSMSWNILSNLFSQRLRRAPLGIGDQLGPADQSSRWAPSPPAGRPRRCSRWVRPGAHFTAQPG